MNHIEPYCFQKYGKPNNVKQVSDGIAQSHGIVQS